MTEGLILYGLSWPVFIIAPACRRRMASALPEHSGVAVLWGFAGLFACLLGAGTHIAGAYLIIRALWSTT